MLLSESYLGDKMKELLIGCGSRTQKDLHIVGDDKFDDVTRLDINSDHNPDVVHDLTVHPLPFLDNTFDEIHAYDVLEHLAQQGDYKFFFSEFSEYWRILKPNGMFFATVPAEKSKWAFGDPSHRRIINLPTLTFLSQKQYEQQVGVTKMSDFRYIYKADFELLWNQETEDNFSFILGAKK